MSSDLVLGRYEHPYWKAYAAVTRAHYGKGTGYYIGCHTGESAIDALMLEAAKTAGLPLENAGCPVTVRESVAEDGRKVLFFLNYSPEEKAFTLPAGENLLTGEKYPEGAPVTLKDWGWLILRKD